VTGYAIAVSYQVISNFVANGLVVVRGLWHMYIDYEGAMAGPLNRLVSSRYPSDSSLTIEDLGPNIHHILEVYSYFHQRKTRACQRALSMNYPSES